MPATRRFNKIFLTVFFGSGHLPVDDSISRCTKS